MPTADEFIEGAAAKLAKAGYSCGKPPQADADSPVLYAEKRVWWFFVLPFRVRYYFYVADDPSPGGDAVYRLHRRSRADVKRRCPWPRFLRFVPPVTASVVVSERGYHPQLMSRIREKKTNRQLGDTNTIVLVDLANFEIATLRRIGFAACVPLERIIHESHELVADLVI